MALAESQTKFGRFVQRIEFKLLMALAYVGFLIYTWISTGKLLPVVFTHLFFMLVVGLIYFFQEIVLFLISPVFLVLWPLINFLNQRYLKKRFKLNTPSETVVVLGHSNWFKLEGWTKPIFIKSDIKWLVRTMEAGKRKFSFYPDARTKDIEGIMRNKDIKEVYFLGHGDSHVFQLGTDEIIYYCDFNDKKYQKEFVHQVHCGKPHGKSLVDYVVPEKNRAKCFLFREPINSFRIKKEFKRRIKELS